MNNEELHCAVLIIGRKARGWWDYLKPGFWVSKRIQYHIKHWSNHVSLVVFDPNSRYATNPNLAGYHHYALNVYESLSRIEKNPICNYLGQPDKYQWEIRVMKEPLKNIEKFRATQEAEFHIGKPYDRMKILWIRWHLLLGGIKRLKRKSDQPGGMETFICTDFIHEVFLAAGRRLFDHEYITPRDFVDSDQMETVDSSECHVGGEFYNERLEK